MFIPLTILRAIDRAAVSVAVIILSSACIGPNQSSVALVASSVSAGAGTDGAGVSSSCPTTGTAVVGDVLATKTFVNSSGAIATGTMTNHAAFDLTGAFSGAGYVSSFTGLAASAVCSTTSLLGTAGTATCVTPNPFTITPAGAAAGATIALTSTEMVKIVTLANSLGSGVASGVLSLTGTDAASFQLIAGPGAVQLGANIGVSLGAANTAKIAVVRIAGWSGALSANLTVTSLTGTANRAITAVAATTHTHSWLRADALTASDGDAIASWTDSGPNNNPVTQATGARQAIYKTNVINGRPVLRFAGAAQQRYRGSLAATAIPWSMYFVYQAHHASSSYMAGWVIDGQDGWIDATFSKGTSANGLYFIGNNGASATLSIGGAAVSPGGGFRIAAVELTGDNTSYTGTLYVDGAVVAGPTLSGGTFSNLTRYLQVGCEKGTATVWGCIYGDIAEVITFSPSLTNDERNAIDCYLSFKYNIPISHACPP